jgi:hypothetical protein
VSAESTVSKDALDELEIRGLACWTAETTESLPVWYFRADQPQCQDMQGETPLKIPNIIFVVASKAIPNII